ncbi:MAG: capsular biosynthesis protein [Neorhizobium sp.]|nr:capsular biosynthesis protein [Neorhizobium sp.]
MNTRTFLFLQGPASPFMRRLAAALESQNVAVRRINFSIGDAVFWWPKHGDWFTGRQKDWPQFLTRYILEHRVSDLLMLGDGRAVHADAANVAIALGVRVHILEHGYLRPDWLTVEPDGMSAHSRFPRDPQAITALADGQPVADTTRLFRSSFLTYALYDLAYHIPNVVLGWLVHPHYRTHGAAHPVVEYSGWIGKAFKRKRRAKNAQASICAWARHHPGTPASSAPPLFFFPLQLPGDYQIIRHAPGGDLYRIVHAVIASFARHAPVDARLLFKIHPIDNGLSRWPSRIGEAARRHDVSDRVFLADGGDTDVLIERATGIVTVNSTVGLTALYAGKPVIALGAAVYDVEGLTSQGPLADFWNNPTPPDPVLLDRFLRALAATTQVRGGFIGEEAVATGVAAVATRLMETQERLPLSFRKDRSEKKFRYAAELSPGE